MTYADITFAEEYFVDRVFIDNWRSCAEKAGFLATASRMIADFAIFPQEDGVDYDTTPPEWLKRATCEQALYLVNLGKDPLQADKKTTLGVASTDGTVFSKVFAADIIAPACRRIIINAGGVIAPGATAGSRSIQSGSVTR